MISEVGAGRDGARARDRLGRFLMWLTSSYPWTLAIAVLALGACAGGGVPGADESPPPPAETLPPLESATPSAAAEATAARLLAEARDSLANGRWEGADRIATRIVSDHPGVRGSSEALWIAARAAWETGDASRAASSARRFVDVLPPTHALVPPARLLEGRALADQGQPDAAVETLLVISPEAADTVRLQALDVIRRSVPEMGSSRLEALAESPPDGWERLRAPVLAEYALVLHGLGRVEDARAAARSAVQLGDEGPEVELARSVIAGDVTVDRRRSALLGSLLPATGSPGEREYATLVQEGIQVRLEGREQLEGIRLDLEILDHEGRSERAAELTRDLIDRGAAALLGPLDEEALAAAARARPVPVPLVSPTARNLPEGQSAVYSLAGPDPAAAEALARYAADRMLEDAVVVHSRSGASTFEAEAFAAEFSRLGGRVLQRLTYPEGSTFFRDQMETVRSLQPAALVLPIPAEDVELLAPQITYFGLDTLGIQVLGTAEWAELSTLEDVEPRHTDGVVVATPRTPGRPTDAYEGFVDDYETTLQKTLRSPIPALGYDAAGLLIEALETGARSPEAVRDALEGIREFEGATGTLSVRDGRIVRMHQLVRLRNREIIPIRMDFQDGGGRR